MYLSSTLHETFKSLKGTHRLSGPQIQDTVASGVVDHLCILRHVDAVLWLLLLRNVEGRDNVEGVLHVEGVQDRLVVLVVGKVHVEVLLNLQVILCLVLILRNGHEHSVQRAGCQ